MTQTILLIHGANLNLLGKRDPRHYGNLNLKQIENMVKQEAGFYGFKVKSFQSNYEGALIDFIQKNSPRVHGIIINAGAFTHYSYALHDALIDADLPAIEVHLSDIKNRENWRRKSVIALACRQVIGGEKEKSYYKAIAVLKEIIDLKA